VSRDATLAMGGWKSGGTEELYGGGLRPATLAREIAKVHYPGLDLSHLQPRVVAEAEPIWGLGPERRGPHVT